MPRKAAVSVASASTSNKSDANIYQTNETKKDIVSIKTECSEEPEAHLSPSKVDFSKFKFEKKPHIKIEYDEKNSSITEETKGLWEPPNWKEFLVNLRIMRSNNDAPVDSMGCHMSMDEDVTPEIYRYQCLISLMLSSQTKDQVTHAAMKRLRSRGLTIDNVLAMSDEELGKLIYPVGFWKTKVKYIKKTTQTLKEQYNGDIPNTAEKLCKLTGVGPKMAHICMLVAWDKVTGIGVDTHVHRISNRIGWVKKPTNTPEDTRKSLETWLPFELWSEVNHLLVGFGQTICQPIGPMCHECLNRDICPSSGKGRKSPKKTPIKVEVKTEKSDDENEPVPLKNRKVTPRKELTENDNVNEAIASGDNIKKEPRKRKVTPKKEINENVQHTQIETDKLTVPIESEDVVKKEPRKRKVTPKKEIKRATEDDIDDFENKTENLTVKTAGRKKVTPIKKKTPVKKANIADNNEDEALFQEKSVSTTKNTRQNMTLNTGSVSVGTKMTKNSPGGKKPLRNKVSD